MFKAKQTLGRFPYAPRLSRSVEKHPFLYFGLPFIGTIVWGSYVLSQMAQCKIDYNSKKNIKLTEDEKKLMDMQLTRPTDIREEYFRLTSRLNLDDYEMVPLPKPSPTAIPFSSGEEEALLIKATEASLKPPPKQPFKHQYS